MPEIIIFIIFFSSIKKNFIMFFIGTARFHEVKKSKIFSSIKTWLLLKVF